MKKSIFLLTAVLIVNVSYAQMFTLGPKIGLSSSKITMKEDVDDYNFTSGDASYGFHAGLFARIQLAGIYIQPEALFTSTSGQIHINSLSNATQEVRKLTYNKIDVPVMVGFRMGTVFRVQAGPVASLILNKDAKKESGAAFDNIKQNYKNATIGYQVGLGLDISKLVIDLKYEGNLSKLGDEVAIGGQNWGTDLRNNQWILSVGYKLF